MKKDYRIPSLPRMFEQVTRQIIQYIVSEKLEPGSKLPTERQLSALLQVSRSSVREGIRVLELLRFLESRQGEGTFVADPPPFFIPWLAIAQPPADPACDHYFEIALMSADHVLTLSLQQNRTYRRELPPQPFWENFCTVVLDLADELPNPYYAALCSDIFQLLTANDYFAKKPAPFALDRFLEAFNRGDLAAVKACLDLLRK